MYSLQRSKVQEKIDGSKSVGCTTFEKLTNFDRYSGQSVRNAASSKLQLQRVYKESHFNFLKLLFCSVVVTQIRTY